MSTRADAVSAAGFPIHCDPDSNCAQSFGDLFASYDFGATKDFATQVADCPDGARRARVRHCAPWRSNNARGGFLQRRKNIRH